MKRLSYNPIWAFALVMISFSTTKAQKHNNLSSHSPKGNTKSTQTCTVSFRIIHSDIQFRVTEPDASATTQKTSVEQRNLGTLTLMMDNGFNYSIWEDNRMDSSPQNMEQQDVSGKQHLQFRVRTQNDMDAKPKPNTKTASVVQIQRGELQLNGNTQPASGAINVDILFTEKKQNVPNEADYEIVVFITGAE